MIRGKHTRAQLSVSHANATRYEMTGCKPVRASRTM
jgi:hypothetical protein